MTNKNENDLYGRMTEDGYAYFSKSKNEYILVSEMNEVHIKNAILSMLFKWLNSLKELEIKEFIDELTNLEMFDYNLTLFQLKKELEKRIQEGDVK